MPPATRQRAPPAAPRCCALSLFIAARCPARPRGRRRSSLARDGAPRRPSAPRRGVDRSANGSQPCRGGRGAAPARAHRAGPRPPPPRRRQPCAVGSAAATGRHVSVRCATARHSKGRRVAAAGGAPSACGGAALAAARRARRAARRGAPSAGPVGSGAGGGGVASGGGVGVAALDLQVGARRLGLLMR